MKKKTIKDRCKSKGLGSTHKGSRQYAISATINKETHVWECSSLRECSEAIFQAECLKKWQMENA